MKNTTRKHIWPVSVVMALAVIGILAAFVVLSALPGTAQAQVPPPPPPPPGTTPTATPDPGSPPPPPPPPAAPNRAPTVASELAAVMLTVGDAATRVDVSGAFSDPDGDDLSYTARSSNEAVAQTFVNGSVVTILAGEVGRANVLVQATDPDGESATQSIAVRVEAANNAPTAVGAIDAVTLMMGASSEPIDVSGNFRDADGDTLTYRARVANPDVATASVAGSMVTVTAAGLGTTSITVTATDPDGASATQRIAVTVEAVTNAPVAVGTIADVTLREDASEAIDVSGNFSDPDGDTLSYAAMSSNTAVATVAIDGSMVTVTGVAAGSATVTVTATDSTGLEAMQTFGVTVDANAPVAVGTIENETLKVGASKVIDVAANFSDADGDTLTYTVKSSNEDVATAAVDGSMVTVTGVGEDVGSTTVTVTATDSTDRQAMQMFKVGVDGIDSSSTSANAGVKLELTIGNLPRDMEAGSSVELYLEDDFQVPDSINSGSVYFTVTNDRQEATNDGGRVYVTDDVEIDTDNHYGGDDDWAIQVFLPDFNTGDDFDGFQGPVAGQTLKLVFLKSAGIKNPSEEGTHSVGYSVLGPNDDANDGSEVDLGTVATAGKISLSDEDNIRGYELTVTGSGFNNGTSAAVHVLHKPGNTWSQAVVERWWNSLDCDRMNAVAGSNDDPGEGFCQPYGNLSPEDKTAVRARAELPALQCGIVLVNGQRAGIATVASDDTVAVTFEVTAPIFGPGTFDNADEDGRNLICMVDGEGRASTGDVEFFELEPSIRVSPSSASVGDTINVYAQDFPDQANDNFTSLEIANQEVYTNDLVDVNAGGIGRDGSATATFRMPGSVGGSPLEGTVRIDAKWGDISEDATITLAGSILRLSVGEARANESVTIQGEGFGSGRDISVHPNNITIDGVPLLVDDDSVDNSVVDVSNAGQFVATVYLWNASGSNNPALTAGTHTIRVQDSAGFYGTATIVIKEPGMTILPNVLGPRDYLTVTGTDWPVDNQDSDANTGNVVVKVEGRSYTVVPDATGRFSLEHRVSRGVAIPSTQQVEASYKEDESGSTVTFIVKTESFEVPAAKIEITPGEGQPGDDVTLSVEGMPVYTEVEEITIGGARVGGSRDFRTDKDGAVTADGLPIPGLDPGTYSVVMKVGSGDTQTVAIGSLNVLLEVAPGAVSTLPDALENLDDNLAAVFYFDNVSKTWSFYDPRPEFAELNTLTELIEGQAYWILVEEAVAEVVLNNRSRSLSCSGGSCWNLVIW